MRFFESFPIALNELKRELAEMGIKVHTKSVQNKNIEGNPDFDTMELQNYTYLVTKPDWRTVPLKCTEWFEQEFIERTCGLALNPGKAWKFRKDYWGQFLVGKTPHFDYAYPERMAHILPNVIEALQKDPLTRRAFLPIFDRDLDIQDAFDVRIPCSLGYWFYYRQEKLNVTYLQRSADFSEHFNYDIALADRLKCYVAEKCNMMPGTFSHWLGSFHVFAKDVRGTF